MPCRLNEFQNGSKSGEAPKFPNKLDGALVKFIPRRPDGAIGRKRSRNGPMGSEEVGG